METAGPNRSEAATFAQPVEWRPSRPRLALTGLAVSWFIGAIALLVGAFIVPGASTEDFGAASRPPPSSRS